VHDSEDLSESESYHAQSFHRHRGYGSIHIASHDFCLIQSETEMALLSNDADIACLPDENQHVIESSTISDNCYVAGWGYSGIRQSFKFTADFLFVLVLTKISIFGKNFDN